MKILVSAVLVFLPTIVLASGSTGYQTVLTLQQRECSGDRGFQITLSADHQNPDGCSNSRVLDIACDSPAFNQMVAMTLTAYSAGHQLEAWVSGCDGEGQAKVTALTIK